MTKPTADCEAQKEEVPQTPPPVYYSTPAAPFPVKASEQTVLVTTKQGCGATLWYVLSIVTSVLCFCWVPCVACSLIGMVHAMIAKHEGEKGNAQGYRHRLFQAKCWTSWAMALILVFLIIVITLWAVGAHMIMREERELYELEDPRAGNHHGMKMD